jgi:hypothetical protein
MTNIIDPKRQKFLVVLVSALVSFFGFEADASAVGLFQIPEFFAIGSAVYVFFVVWQKFIFDLHLKPASSWRKLERTVVTSMEGRFDYLREGKHWLHFQNYLILPGIIYWSTLVLLYLNPFDQLRKQVWIVLSTLALAAAAWYLKTVFYAHHETSRHIRQVIFLAKVYASFLVFSASLGVIRFFDYGPALFGLVVFLMSFLLMYQALFQHHYVGFKMLKFLFIAGILLGAVGYMLYALWNVNFYGAALVLTALYNATWGMVHHEYIDKNLTREIVYEYLAVLFVVLVIIFSTTNFSQRI